MRALWMFTLLLFAPAVAAPRSAPPPPAAVQSAIRSLYPRISRAVETRDAAAYGRLLAPDWKGTDLDLGRIDRKRMLAEFVPRFRPLLDIRHKYIIHRMDYDGTTVGVVYTEITAGNMHDGDKLRRVAVTVNALHAWKRIGGAWKMTGSVMLRTQTIMDGKVIREGRAKITVTRRGCSR